MSFLLMFLFPMSDYEEYPADKAKRCLVDTDNNNQ